MTSGKSPEPVEKIAKMRESLLRLDPKSINIAVGPQPQDVWAVLMELGWAETLVILVALKDGSASIYTGSGGGVIGGHFHEGVRHAAIHVVEAASSYLKYMVPADEFPLPDVGHVKFWLCTGAGVYTVDALENTLANNEHELGALYGDCQAVISGLRAVSEKREKDAED